MQIGWLDFSPSERSKVLSVMDLLSEDATLDELGIAPIRDGFANRFFPGTSTIQTRAKYFFIVPYALMELERSRETDPRVAFESMKSKERECGEKLLLTGNDGIIGNKALKNGNWVKRSPMDIYWAGIRRYGIFTAGNLSSGEYLRASCSLKKQKLGLRQLGNRKDEAEENEQDDLDSGGLIYTRFWKLPDYDRKHWFEQLKIDLTQYEAAFLKTQITSNCADSLLAFLLARQRHDVLAMSGFNEVVTSLAPVLPISILQDMQQAKAFSEFLYGARIRYNVILSNGKNEEANDEWAKYETDIQQHADVDISGLFLCLALHNPMLKRFLMEVKSCMDSGDISNLDKVLVQRECQLKGPTRAKLMHPGEFGDNKWVGGSRLDYRFGAASRILRDIFEGEGTLHAEAVL